MIQSNLIKKVSGPVSNSTGGTSKGNPSAGTGTTVHVEPPHAITTGDKAGAGVLTAVVIVSLLGGGYVSIVANSSFENRTNLSPSGCQSTDQDSTNGRFGHEKEMAR